MSRPFIAIIPQTMNSGDKVVLKGILKDGANEFSINFATGTGPNPDDITYHFKTIIHDSLIVENCKRDGDWMEEQIKQWPSADGPGFALEFAFTNGYVYTYWVEGEHSRNLISFYEYDSDLSEIDSVQVWGDVEKIHELTFRYS